MIPFETSLRQVHVELYVTIKQLLQCQIKQNTFFCNLVVSCMQMTLVSFWNES